mmetsp:Transcript_38191/g.124929  ORF Transcript_38191/g.124929 Transcript_38191/m.124929 type:complete len:91 (+) Transcript_38191:42-314(+)
MSSQLRGRFEAARQQVQEDLATLQDLASVVERNKAELDANNARLREQIDKMRTSKCQTWLMVLLVCLMYVGTYLVMKLFPKPRPFQVPPG